MENRDVLIYEVRDHVAYITLNQPEKHNALSRGLCGKLRNAWMTMENDPEVRVGVVTGAGRTFCGGGDVREMGAPLEGKSDNVFLDAALPNIGVSVNKPLIAAINGAVVGAGLALCHNCDIRIASKNALFVFPEAKVGICKGGLGLLNFMDTTTAVEMMLTGEPIDAERAYRAGFLNRVVDPEALQLEADRFADIIKRNAPLTMKMLKAYILEHNKTLMDAWNMMYHRYIFPQEGSDDLKEGLSAFREKRAPEFKGK